MKKLVVCCGLLWLAQMPVSAYDFPGTGSATAWSEALPYYNMGNKMMNQQRFDEAAEMYRQAIQRYPHDADFHLNLGVAYRKLDNYTGAEEAYKAALQINDKDWATWSNLGNAYLKQNKLKETLAAFERALKCNPPQEDRSNLMTDINDLHKVMKNMGIDVTAEQTKAPSKKAESSSKPSKAATQKSLTTHPTKSPAIKEKEWGYQ